MTSIPCLLFEMIYRFPNPNDLGFPGLTENGWRSLLKSLEGCIQFQHLDFLSMKSSVIILLISATLKYGWWWSTCHSTWILCLCENIFMQVLIRVDISFNDKLDIEKYCIKYQSLIDIERKHIVNFERFICEKFEGCLFLYSRVVFWVSHLKPFYCDEITQIIQPWYILYDSSERIASAHQWGPGASWWPLGFTHIPSSL